MIRHNHTALLRRVALVSTLGLAAFGGVSRLAFAQDDRVVAISRAANRLTVTGTGEVKVTPDKADVVIGVTTQDKSSRKAAEANAESARKVQDAMKAVGIAARDLQTSSYSIQPVFSEPDPAHPNRNPSIAGYRVSNQVRVTVRDLTKLSDVLDAATANDANTIEGLTLGKENQTEAENQALEKAVADARRKAAHLSQAAGIQILGVAELNEGQIVRPFEGNMMFAAKSDFSRAATPISPGEMSVTANVTIVYTIAPAKQNARALPKSNRFRVARK